uniref:Uncharacterized protein n=1 Tax=Pelusios castaneus TaxID=367368 RepID=A0A8C8RZR7_9SAUR
MAHARPHQLLPHSLMGSSDQSLQSLCRLHTLSIEMHSPERHLNLSGPSQTPTSSLRSLQSNSLSHWRLPWMQSPLLHWNSSGRHVGFTREEGRDLQTQKQRRAPQAATPAWRPAPPRVPCLH